MLRALNQSVRRPILPALIIFLFASAIYLFAFPQPNVIYPVIVLLHVLGGVVACFLIVPALLKCVRARSFAALAWLLMAGGAAIGLILISTGTSRSDWNLLYAHIVLCTAAAVGLLLLWTRMAWESMRRAKRP